jgi:hypothetical protein
MHDADGTRRQVQRALLTLILRKHPAPMTFPQLFRELLDDSPEDSGGYALACAVRDLVMVDLLHCDGIFVLPTRAALHLAQLETGPGYSEGTPR